MANCSFQWRNFNESFSSGLGALQESNEFVDMTIAADGHMVKVHQLVIGLASPYLKRLILATPTPHPVIHLTNVPINILSGILEYIYTGEVTVPRNIMDQFLQVARDLQIKGLQYATENSATESFSTMKRFAKPIMSTDYYSPKRLKSSLDENVVITEDNIQTDHAPVVQFVENTENESTEKVDENVEAIFKSQELKYTISNQGSLQLILNRYMYNSTNELKSKDAIRWRCIQQRASKCLASTVTENGMVVKRKGMHNHPFHDSKIYKKIQDGKVFSTIKETEEKLGPIGGKKRKGKQDEGEDDS